jgi:hypothetical protein
MLLNNIQPHSHILLDVFDDTVVFRHPKNGTTDISVEGSESRTKKSQNQ